MSVFLLTKITYLPFHLSNNLSRSLVAWRVRNFGSGVGVGVLVGKLVGVDVSVGIGVIVGGGVMVGPNN